LKKRALITGITGQDGSYLAEFLLAKGYEVHGLIRRASTFNTHRIDHLYKDQHEEGNKLFLHYGDLSDGSRLTNLISKIEPDEIYDLAAQSHVRVSFDEPEHTGYATGIGTFDTSRPCVRVEKIFVSSRHLTQNCLVPHTHDIEKTLRFIPDFFMARPVTEREFLTKKENPSWSRNFSLVF
jgi:GDP-mannose 4,6-dehydratase